MKPVPKVAAGGVAAAAVVVITWAAAAAGYELPVEVAVALVALAQFAAAWVKSG